jgi:hypothetical protein
MCVFSSYRFHVTGMISGKTLKQVISLVIFFNRYLQGFISWGCAVYVLVANTFPSHLMDQFYKLIRMNFIIFADILSTNFNVFNNPSLFLSVL